MLAAVEFETKVQNGLIQVPDEYKQEFSEGDDIKVIILIKHKLHRQKDIIDELTENPVLVDGFLSREEVYNSQCFNACKVVV
ncbi:hypothetical protein NIES4071_38080 [Calothrix sp. NIES-4071]|nr:hypothetical protein NIES4071_38080 [Calothrix sp. NIES-4071]BAZ58125.1 hypothetical protein NIES4105_38010 [Calothrix sp. NIES-4105]